MTPPFAAKNLLVDIVIPFYNEEKILRSSVQQAISFLKSANKSNDCRITLADNGSDDDSPSICRELQALYPNTVRILDVKGRGKGLAIRKAWQASEAATLVFMDMDMATDISFLPKLIELVEGGRADLAIGNRLGKNSKIISRKVIRGTASRIFNILVRFLLGTAFDDHQCGFKAMSSSSFKSISGLLREDGFLFDTELIAVSQKHGLKIQTLDVIWRDGDESKVSLFSDTLKMFLGIVKLRSQLYRI